MDDFQKPQPARRYILSVFVLLVGLLALQLTVVKLESWSSGVRSDNEVARDSAAAAAASGALEAELSKNDVASLTTPVPATDVASSESSVHDATAPPVAGDTHRVLKVVDGDTLDVDISGKVERVRLIGVDTPETVDPRKTVQCFGKEASAYMKQLLTGKSVRLVHDPSQGERDKYSRLLRYVFLENGTHVNEALIRGGYAHEYTYNTAYTYQAAFHAAERKARAEKRGLWGAACEGSATLPGAVPSVPATTAPASTCMIKGNINSTGDKIFHTPGCGSYEKTVISEAQGERWFCTEAEALNAGWRKAKNCE